ncbi:MAG: hypothetical protein QXH30_01715 [Candidatus Bilamarchaeaceae archaeon]
MPKVPKEDLKKEVKAEGAPTRSVKRLFSLAHERATRAIVSVSLAAALASCSPSTLNAQETTPAKGKPEVAAVEKDKKPVTYETIADLSELQPYLDNAKDKVLVLEVGKENKFGQYAFWAGNTIRNITEFKVKVLDKPDAVYSINIRGPPEDINVLTLDMGDNHPYIEGKMLVFANYDHVHYFYFNKQKNEYESAVVVLEEGKMRHGPVQTGYGVDEGGLFVITAPKKINAGDVIAQAVYAKDGSVGHWYFVYDPKKPAGTQIASTELRLLQ